MPVYFENSAPVTTATVLTITAANTAQIVFPDTKRNYLLFQNNSDTDMWMGIGYTPSVGTGIRILANGGSFVSESGFIPSGAVRIACGVSGKAFYAIQG